MRDAAKRVEGVRDVKVSFARKVAVVTYDSGKTTPDAIAKAITARTRFKVTPQPDAKK